MSDYKTKYSELIKMSTKDLYSLSKEVFSEILTNKTKTRISALKSPMDIRKGRRFVARIKTAISSKS